MNIINKKIEDSENIVKLIQDYYEKIILLYPDKEDKTLLLMDKNIRSFTKLCENIKINHDKYVISEDKNEIEPLLIDTINLYRSYVAYFDNIIDIQNILKKQEYDPENNMMSSNFSQTFKLETSDMFHELILKIDKYFLKYQDIDTEFIQYLSNNILQKIFDWLTDVENNEEKILKVVNYLGSVFLQDSVIINFYVVLIQTFIDKLYDSSEKQQFILMYKILDMVNDIEKKYMEKYQSNYFSNSINKNIHLINPSLKKFELVPHTNNLPIQELLHMIIPNQEPGKKINMENYAKSHKVLFIIVKKIVPTPVEYNIRPLIVKKIADELRQPSERGINVKTIERFSNIIPLDNSTHYKWDFNYKIIGNLEESNDSTSCYILETLDGSHYRAFVSRLDHQGNVVKKYSIQHLIDYIINVNQPDKSSCYHLIQSINMSKVMFTHRSLLIHELEKKSQEIDVQMLRNDLFIKISGLINDSIKHKSPKNNSDINSIIHDPKIPDLFKDIILRMYSAISNNPNKSVLDAGDFKISEILSTFLIELNDLSKHFMKELHDAYNHDLLETNTFRLPLSEKNEIIKKKMEETLLKVISISIGNGDNIYSSINYKYLILNF